MYHKTSDPKAPAANVRVPDRSPDRFESQPAGQLGQHRQMNSRLYKYELLNIALNGYTFFFGVLFPLFFSIIIIKSVLKDVPPGTAADLSTSIFLGIAMIIPMATMFIGYAASFANEIEKQIPDRLSLYGFSQKTLLLAKLTANLTFLTAALLIYIGVDALVLDILRPTAAALVVFLLVFYSFAVILLVLAHGLGTLFRKFGPTYAITMILYFAIMMLSGMMGVSYDALPGWIHPISNLLPPKHIGQEFVAFWKGEPYNFAPLIQSLVFFAALAGLILLFSFYRQRRRQTA